MHQAIIQMQTTIQTTTQAEMQTTTTQITTQTKMQTTTQTTILAKTHLVKMPAVQTTDTRNYKKDCTERAIFFIDSPI